MTVGVQRLSDHVVGEGIAMPYAAIRAQTLSDLGTGHRMAVLVLTALHWIPRMRENENDQKVLHVKILPISHELMFHRQAGRKYSSGSSLFISAIQTPAVAQTQQTLSFLNAPKGRPRSGESPRSANRNLRDTQSLRPAASFTLPHWAS